MGADEKRRGVRMTDDEAWECVEDAHTGIVTTLRRDGFPIALPLWFAAIDRRIYLSTRGKKLLRLRNDPRASFLVESGERWVDLKAVHFTCEARFLDEHETELIGQVRAELDRKYAGFGLPSTGVSKETKDHYRNAALGLVELTPVGRVLTWDNSLLGLA